MKSRRSFLLSLTCGLTALAVLVVPAIADELLGTIKSVDVEGKKIVVAPKGEEKEVEVTINDDTEIETAKGKKIQLKNLARIVEKTQGKARATITHEKSVASKIVLKGAPKKKDDRRD